MMKRKTLLIVFAFIAITMVVAAGVLKDYKTEGEKMNKDTLILVVYFIQIFTILICEGIFIFSCPFLALFWTATSIVSILICMYITTNAIKASHLRIDYKKMWVTLKAESGYRDTIQLMGGKEILRTLMERMEERGLMEAREK